MTLNSHEIVQRLKTIESLALATRVTSTNLLGKKIAAECIENEIPLPSAMLIARMQTAGRGRESRSWHSPSEKGIYATILHTRPLAELPLVPLAIGVIVAGFLRETYAIEARIKWPNDIVVGRAKIAGTLIEARLREEAAALIIGTGINIEPLGPDGPPNATSVSEQARGRAVDVDSATVAFIEFLDAQLSRPFERDETLRQWRSLSTHAPGDALSCVVGGRSIEGRWQGIDEQGRAMIGQGEETIFISAGDLMMVEPAADEGVVKDEE